MSYETISAGEMAALYRSEAFAEDLEDLLPAPLEVLRPARRALWASWTFVLPLTVAVLGSASALVWV